MRIVTALLTFIAIFLAMDSILTPWVISSALRGNFIFGLGDVKWISVLLGLVGAALAALFFVPNTKASPETQSKYTKPNFAHSADELPTPEFYSEAEYKGARDINSPQYQIFLVQKFCIEKNNTLEKYIMGDEVYRTLEDVLQCADDRYARAQKIREDEISALMAHYRIDTKGELFCFAGKEFATLASALVEAKRTIAPPKSTAVCPNDSCRAMLPPDALACWKCGASFADPAGWKPLS
jgi:hypothetical protein